MVNQMKPVHPGEILREELDFLELSANAIAEMLAVPTNRVTTILKGQRSITADTAIRLAMFFGTSPEFWLNLQRDYDLKVTMAEKGAQLKKDIKPLGNAA